MKTAVSLPDDLFAEGEQLAERLAVSRSRLYADALREYVQRRREMLITEALNQVYEKESSALPIPQPEATRALLADSDW